MYACLLDLHVNGLFLKKKSIDSEKSIVGVVKGKRFPKLYLM